MRVYTQARFIMYMVSPKPITKIYTQNAGIAP